MNISIAAAVNSRTVLERNLVASPGLHENRGHEILVQESFASAAAAYNDALDRSKNDLVMFVHQDMYLPSGWFSRLEESIAKIERTDPNWGLIGCWGVTQDGAGFGHVYSPGVGIIGSRFEEPREVQTLDEIVLIMRKSSGLRFDDTLPHFHFYGVDICLSARKRGLKNYAMSAFCVHNSNYLRVLPQEFYDCYRHVKRRWKDSLPIQTSCIRISRFDKEMRRRQLREAIEKLRGRTTDRLRVDDPGQLYAGLGAAL